MSASRTGPQMNKFEQIPSLGHKMSLAGGRSRGQRDPYTVVQLGPMSWGRGQGPCMVRCNGNHPRSDRQTRLKTLPSHNFVGGSNEVTFLNRCSVRGFIGARRTTLGFLYIRVKAKAKIFFSLIIVAP